MAQHHWRGAHHGKAYQPPANAVEEDQRPQRAALLGRIAADDAGSQLRAAVAALGAERDHL